MRTLVQVLLLSATAFCAHTWADDEAANEKPRSFASVTRTNTVGVNPVTDRAFFGAPPPIRHVGIVASERTTDCLQCHAKENRVHLRQQAIAPVPHAEFSQCTQCHVQAKPDVEPFRGLNTFIGLDLPGKGSRAHPHAPPTVPHKTFMRENCNSCHGPTGLWRIKTPHPFRTVCLQCHAPEGAQQLVHPAAKPAQARRR